MAVPIRTCAGCGRKAPRIELLRFACVSGELKAVPESRGRGAYTCRQTACFERALTAKSFNRALRTAVRVDPALRDLYTDADG
ncbi:MAG: YlxR family protein [Gaiellaceae bacterium]